MSYIEIQQERTDMSLTEWMRITGASQHYVSPEVERMNAWDEIIREARRQKLEMEDADIVSHKN
jgi:hypothetical protein